jgi:predicted AlkP superfamily pyrophosphatase or phosphodiesterase
MRRLLPLAALTLCLPLTAQQAAKQPLVVLISIDGLKPEAILQADAHHLKLPNLRAMVHDGTYAEGVTGVLPTLTYPSHTTILTGVSPAKHGIYSNTTFDPLNKNAAGWYWYAEDIRVPTLWDAAHTAHIRTANVYWPVSVSAHIDDNLAQLWRAGTPDDLKLQRSVSTPGLITELEIAANVPGAPNTAAMDAAPGHYPGSEDETVADDEIRSRYAIQLLHSHHPRFITIYFTGLDTQQHKTGPFSPEADAVLERIDTLIGNVRAAAESELPGHAYICVISDHGFAPVQHDVNLYKEFLAAGLITFDASHAVASWRATLWPMGGSAAVILHDPSDTATRTQVDALLAKLASDPANGIDRILPHDEVVKDGGLPDAESIVSMAPGYELGYQFAGPLVTPGTNGGMHGYPPDRPEMHSTFLLTGPTIPANHSVGQIDMRSIAPTLAHLMHAPLPTADLPPLTLK